MLFPEIRLLLMTLPDIATRHAFFTGKGGVGKTSLSCATGLALADAGKRVLIVSTDPASNLDEALGTPLGSIPTAVDGAANLFALNIDPEAAAAAYRERMVAPYRGVLPAAAIQSMEEQFSGACTVEIAAFDRPPYVNVHEPSVEYLAAYSPEYGALGRGVAVRGVYHPGFDRDRLTELTLFLRAGEQAKLGDVPMKLMLFDRKSAVLPAPQSYAPEPEVKATVVRHPVVVEALSTDAVVHRASHPVLPAGVAGCHVHRLHVVLTDGGPAGGLAVLTGAEP